MNAYQFIRESIERERPDLMAALYPRIYQGADDWESPAVAAAHLAGAARRIWSGRRGRQG